MAKQKQPAADEPKGPPEGEIPPVAEAGLEGTATDESAAETTAVEAKSKRRRRQHGRQSDGKHIRAARTKVDKLKKYPLEDAINLLQKAAPKRKFDETVELVMKLGIDPRKQGQALRGSISLPKGVGRTNRVIAFCEPGSDAAKEAEAAGAVAVGLDDLIARIEADWDDFEVAIAHPTVMRFIGKLGKKLGTKGKMPSPKAGTVTTDIGLAVREFKAGRINFRADGYGNVHAPVGKRSFSVEDLMENIHYFIDHMRSLRPADQKGVYIQKVVVSTTMGPGIPLEVSQ